MEGNGQKPTEIKHMKRFILLAILPSILALASCVGSQHKFSEQDLAIINTNPDSLLHIYTIENPEELKVLRSPSYNLTKKELHSEAFQNLARRMIYTVSHPSVNGLGLAAPQIGINKAVIVVHRVDKEGMPYEVYPNISIVESSEEITISQEGCLSIPGKRGDVDRSVIVVIEYYSLSVKKVVRDTINSYASVIFQHETDHLDGILYTDRTW